jgi:dynein heavy chain
MRICHAVWFGCGPAQVNDIIEHRIEKNLLIVSKTKLVSFRDTTIFSLEDFVVMQEQHINAEVEV